MNLGRFFFSYPTVQMKWSASDGRTVVWMSLV